MLQELITNYDSNKVVYGCMDGIINKQVERIFTLTDDQYFKQMTHIDQSKIIAVTKSCINYSLIKHCGFVVQLKYSDKPDISDNDDESREETPEFTDFI